MSTLFDLTGRRAIVTGGGRGLGLGITQGLHDAGAAVAILGRRAENSEVAGRIGASGAPVRAVLGDLSDRDEARRMFGEAVEWLGGVDILVNNAGIQRRSPSERFAIEDWDDVLETNLTSVFALCQMAGRIMLEQGHGKIINIASMGSFFGGLNIPAYAASKGGVVQLTKTLSNEWAGRGVQVNAIAPGYMATDMNTALIDDAARNAQIMARIPAGRWGLPEDMAGAAVFLASSASDYVTGAVIPVDGGYLVR
ncbi:MAG: 3-oxoacyl-ACP reductase FabG [Clostridiales bacterium]|nr:3-oxoacyl-ACP reductase FabG [Clostridiales bacterium]